MPDNSVLLVTYLFPPIGGPGVQRNLKYVKYLPMFNWDPWVLTVKHINYHVYDSSLLDEVQDPAKVIRTGSLDPLRLTSFMAPAEKDIVGKQAVRNNRLSMTSLPVKLYRATRDLITFPDPQVGWIPFAYHHGLKVIRENNIKAIVGAMEPVSDTVVAYLLSRKTGVPYLIDYRDSWTNDPYRPMPSSLHRKAHVWLENEIVRHASAITVYDDCMRTELEQSYPEVRGKVDVLPNGFDPADLEGVTPMPRPADGRFRIVYSGSLYNHHDANLLPLLKAIATLPADIRSKLELVFVGQSYPACTERIEAFGLGDQIQVLGYRPHSEALSYLLSADASLLFVEPGNLSAITGKVFEYLMIGAPMLACIPPDGACASLLRRSGFDRYIVSPTDVAAIADMISELVRSRGAEEKRSSVQQFSRLSNTQKLARHLDSIVVRSSISRHPEFA